MPVKLILLIITEVKLVIEKLKKNNFIYSGKIKAPKNEDKKEWVEREQVII